MLLLRSLMSFYFLSLIRAWSFCFDVQRSFFPFKFDRFTKLCLVLATVGWFSRVLSCSPFKYIGSDLYIRSIFQNKLLLSSPVLLSFSLFHFYFKIFFPVLSYDIICPCVLLTFVSFWNYFFLLVLILNLSQTTFHTFFCPIMSFS